jgi:hypothetical protein
VGGRLTPLEQQLTGRLIDGLYRRPSRVTTVAPTLNFALSSPYVPCLEIGRALATGAG